MLSLLTLFAALAAPGDALPIGLGVDVDDGTLGRDMVVSITNAAPGEVVHLIYGRDGAGSGACVSVLGGQCLGVAGPPAVLGSAVADGSGTATLTLSVPDNPALLNRQACVQAIAIRGPRGANGVGSPAECVNFNPCTEGDAGDRVAALDIECSGSFPEVVPFSEFSLGSSTICGGPGNTSAFGRTSNFTQVGFEVDTTARYQPGDMLSIGFTGFSTGSTGMVSVQLEVSNDNQSWMPLGSLPARNFEQNSTRDSVMLPLPISGDALYVRMTSDIDSGSLIYVAGFDAALMSTCP